MNAFLEALESVLSIFVLIVIGYLLQQKGKITDKIGSFISFFVVNITLPCSVYKTLTTSLSMEDIAEIPMYIILIMVSQLLSIAGGWCLANLFGVDKEISGSFITLKAFNNTIFMGLPVNIALFGESSSPIVLYYYLASTILFWTLGVRIIAGNNKTGKFNIPKTIYAMVIAAVVITVTIFRPNFTMPVFVVSTVNNLASMTTPLSMIFTGVVLGNFGIKNIRFDKNVVLGLIARFVVSPLIFIVIIISMPVSELAKNVFIVQAFMPVMASQTIIARQYGVNDEYPAVMVTVSTLISLLVIPFVKVLLI